MTDQSGKWIFVLVFHARRAEKRKWFQFWRRNYAEVYSYIYAKGVQDAKEVAQSEMHRKGLEILRYTAINRLEEGNYPPENLRLIESAKKRGANYRHYGLPMSAIEDLEGKTEPLEIASRYVDYEDVTIDLSEIPRELHCIVPYAEKWAICGDVERSEYKKRVSKEEVKEFHKAVSSRVESIESYCNQRRNETPVPDEVVLFDLMLEAFAEIGPGIEHVDSLQD